MSQMQFSPYIQKYSKKDIDMGEVLGQGSFGVVQKGKIKGATVALKIIKVNTGLKQDAQVELNTMAEFRHKNVLKLLGIIEENFSQKPILIFEFMEYGSLIEYIAGRKAVDDNILVGLVYDVACGMDYLHEMQYVHRDLAGRNVLVDSNGRAKVADFGLSRFVDTDTASYYRIEQDKPLPFRWVPKECIPTDTMTGRFTFASDVWSFGVTMWETWNKGALPYRSFGSTNEVVKVIQQGKNPNSFEKPACPPKILEIMDLIFKVDPKQRPSFAVLKIKLNEIKSEKPKVPQKPPPHVAANHYEDVATKLAKNLGKLNLKLASAGHVQLIQKLKENGRIKTARLEKVMAAVDRGDYVKSENPYNDKPQSIGCNVNISAPHMHAFMLELVAERLKEGGRALDIGSGSGYVTACMGLLVGPNGKVFGIDHMTDLATQSIENIKKSYPEMIEKGIIRIVVGDGRKGYAEGGPYDVIHIGASTPIIHKAISDQLREGGRIVTPVGPAGDSQELVGGQSWG